MATLVIGNTYCGGGRGHDRVVDLAARIGGDAVLATRAGHAESLARDAGGRYERVVAAGGDGTTHEVANGLLALPLDDRPTLGLLPLGTGNDIARNLGLLTVDAALAAIASGSTRGLDVFRVDCHDALGRPLRVHGLLNCGIGYGAEVVRRTTQRVKRVAGPALGYLWGTLSALIAWDSPSMTLAGDFGCWRGRAFFASLCNGELECGGSLRMAPGASMCDGTAHLVLVRRAARPLLAGKLALLSSGGHIGQPQVSYLPTTWLQVGAQRPLGLQCDGDVVGYSPCTITLLPHALEVFAP